MLKNHIEIANCGNEIYFPFSGMSLQTSEAYRDENRVCQLKSSKVNHMDSMQECALGQVVKLLCT